MNFYVYFENEQMASRASELVKEARKSKGIRIVYRNVGDDHVQILYAGALKFTELPDEYRYYEPHVYKNYNSFFVNSNHIVPGNIITKQKFSEIVNICRQAGDRLRKINKAKRDAEPKLLKI